MAIDIGRIAYQAHVDHLAKEVPIDTSLYKWEDLGKLHQDAWRHAACAVLQYIDKSMREHDEGLCG